MRVLACLRHVVLLFKISLFKDCVDPMTEFGNIHIGAWDIIFKATDAPRNFSAHIVLAMFVVWNLTAEW